MSVLWATLVLCCLGALIAIVFGLLFRRAILWRFTTALLIAALGLAVAIAFLDRFGFGGYVP